MHFQKPTWFPPTIKQLKTTTHKLGTRGRKTHLHFNRFWFKCYQARVACSSKRWNCAWRRLTRSPLLLCPSLFWRRFPLPCLPSRLPQLSWKPASQKRTWGEESRLGQLSGQSPGHGQLHLRYRLLGHLPALRDRCLLLRRAPAPETGANVGGDKGRPGAGSNFVWSSFRSWSRCRATWCSQWRPLPTLERLKGLCLKTSSFQLQVKC